MFIRKYTGVAGGNDEPAATPCSNSVCLTIINDVSKQANLYIGEAVVLEVVLVNGTGADLPLASGAKLDIYFNSLNVNLGNCKISLTDWTFLPGTYALSLTYSGASGVWGQGDTNALRFQISNVQSSLSQETSGFFQLNLSGITGNNVPKVIKTPLALMTPPKPGDATLDDILVTLDNNTVFVTKSGAGLLENTLFLNITNTGGTALFKGKPENRGNPSITISFVYGSTPGALAPDNDKDSPQTGSAWNIKSQVVISEGNDWTPTDPDHSAKPEDPVWTLTPAPNNISLLGTGDASSIKVAFKHIISETTPGVTLMYVQFKGFVKNDSQKYDSKLFVLTINKQNPPVNQGIIYFSNPDDTVPVTSPTNPIPISLNWALMFADHIKIDLPGYTAHLPGGVPYTKVYGSAQPLVADSVQIPVSPDGFQNNTNLQFKMFAYDSNDNLLKPTATASVVLDVEYFQDSDGQIYPLVSLGTTRWFARNWNFDAGSGSQYYNNYSGNAKPYGRLYTWDGIKNNLPAGWRLPTVQDWQNLIAFYGSGQAAYAALIQGGNSFFNAQLGGFANTSNGSPIWKGLDPVNGAGYYWTGTGDLSSGTANFMIFSGSSKVLIKNSSPWPADTNWMSCRFVRDA